MSGRNRIVMIALGVAVLVAAAVVAVVSNGDGDQTGKPAAVTSPTGPTGATGATGVAEAKPKVERGPLLESGEVTDVEADKGEIVRFRARSETDEEIHVHGYDITKPLPAGEIVNFRFRADLDGVFEIELHGTGEQIGELTVNP